MKENYELKSMARESLNNLWVPAVVVTLIYAFCVGIFGSYSRFGFIISLIISGPFELGYVLFVLSVKRNHEGRIEQIFDGFRDFGRSFQAYLLMIIFVVLWSLLLIVPGIIAALSYSMTFFILADDKSVPPRGALDRSKEMMYGNKAKLFYLYLSFIGWFFLSILTAGIGFFWLIPYVRVSVAHFYDDLKNNQQMENSYA